MYQNRNHASINFSPLLSDSKRTPQDHGHYIISKMIQVLRVRPESLFVRGAVGNDDTAAPWAIEPSIKSRLFGLTYLSHSY